MFRDFFQKTDPKLRHIPVCLKMWVPPPPRGKNYPKKSRNLPHVVYDFKQSTSPKTSAKDIYNDARLVNYLSWSNKHFCCLFCLNMHISIRWYYPRSLSSEYIFDRSKYLKTSIQNISYDYKSYNYYQSQILTVSGNKLNTNIKHKNK